MDERQEFNIKKSVPTFSNVSFFILFFCSNGVMVLLNEPYNSLFVLLMIPWISYTIYEMRAKKLTLDGEQIHIGKLSIDHKDIERMIIHNEKLEIHLRDHTWLTRLITLEVKDKQDREQFYHAMQQWKVKFNGIK